jgi:hypothetical protein
MDENELNYVLMRVQQERLAADEAADPRSAAAHRRLAEHYEAMLKGMLPAASPSSHDSRRTPPHDRP